MAKMRKVTTPKVPEPTPPNYSNCKVVGDQVYISGMTATEGDAHVQAMACFGKIKALIEAAGGKMSDVIKLNIFITDIKFRPEIGRARAEFFKAGDMPCSTLVQVVALADPRFLVEIEAVAFLGAT
ncbi:MAG: RidA family protein [Alphaproteobacteria bacterium]|nr:RidA family protein [Alphaproteobacteria bacterium]